MKEPVSDSRMLLGTSCLVTIFNMKTPDKASILINDSLDTVGEMEKRLSINLKDSEISTLNTNGRNRLSSDSLYVLREALSIAELSKGLFDPTIGTLVKLWGIGSDDEHLPQQHEIEKALKTIDYNSLEINGNIVKIQKENQMIDLGGIAKGHAADLVKDELIRGGVSSAIINLGGNILLIGRKVDGSFWRIGIQNPRDIRGSFVGILECEDNAIVTSGIYERYFQLGDEIYHHILNPDTGYPVNNSLLSMTVIAHNSLIADGLSTALFAMGLDGSMAYAESREEIDIIVIDENNNVYISSGIRDKFKMTDSDYSLIL